MKAFVFDLGDTEILVLSDTEESARKTAILNYPNLNDADTDPPLLADCPVREVGLGDVFEVRS
jgi:hypothetical protein